MVSRRRKKKRRKKQTEIEVRLGRLGDEVRTFVFPTGTTVQDVLDKAEIDGSAHTVKMNGRKVSMEKRLTRNCSLVAIVELKAGAYASYFFNYVII